MMNPRSRSNTAEPELVDPPIDIPTRPRSNLTIDVTKCNMVVGVYYTQSDYNDRFGCQNIGEGDVIHPSCDSIGIASVSTNPSTDPCRSPSTSSPAPTVRLPTSPRSISSSIDNQEHSHRDKGGSVLLDKREDKDTGDRVHRTDRQTMKKRPRQKNERSYDMNLVPNVTKNAVLLHKYRQLDELERKKNQDLSFVVPALVPCDRTMSLGSFSSEESEGKKPECAANESIGQVASSKPCQKCSLMKDLQLNLHDMSSEISSPFGANSDSVIWIPKTRAEWEDCIDEMTAICTAAAWRRHKKAKKSKTFYPPLSRIYIRDRIDVDDPMIGYQIRHKNGGWLQGFVTMTTFTTWTHFFKWDSLHPKNGITKGERTRGRADDGTMSTELERQSRSGDPNSTGVVWPTVAEISLVGALGCGEFLVQMALDDLAKRGNYDYVVLQATAASRPFYEKLGFVRVGAISKYGNAQDFESNASGLEEVGYRHWTYANETAQGLNEHGAPSIIMAHKIGASRKCISGTQSCKECGCQLYETPSFINMFSRFFVEEKPEILPLFPRERKRPAGVITPPGEKNNKSKKRKVSSDSDEGTRKSNDDKHSFSDIILSPSVITDEAGASRNSCSSTKKKQTQKKQKPSLNSKVKKQGVLSGAKELKKQKIVNKYRHPKKTYFYNKVVTPIDYKRGECKYLSKYYFVLNYDDHDKTIRVIPLVRKGTFKGKREGRQKWKATVLDRTTEDIMLYWKSMNVITCSSLDWKIVPAYQVTKCSSVAEESFDIFDQADN